VKKLLAKRVYDRRVHDAQIIIRRNMFDRIRQQEEQQRKKDASEQKDKQEQQQQSAE
jgi:hypothetical protein